ncbi:unnamed protein product [Closterium sp. Naga37s-1]|nr:unnamed protein product [Closterium sp. Naga37s-1]
MTLPTLPRWRSNEDLIEEGDPLEDRQLLDQLPTRIEEIKARLESGEGLEEEAPRVGAGERRRQGDLGKWQGGRGGRGNRGQGRGEWVSAEAKGGQLLGQEKGRSSDREKERKEGSTRDREKGEGDREEQQSMSGGCNSAAAAEEIGSGAGQIGGLNNESSEREALSGEGGLVSYGLHLRRALEGEGEAEGDVTALAGPSPDAATEGRGKGKQVGGQRIRVLQGDDCGDVGDGGDGGDAAGDDAAGGDAAGGDVSAARVMREVKGEAGAESSIKAGGMGAAAASSAAAGSHAKSAAAASAAAAGAGACSASGSASAACFRADVGVGEVAVTSGGGESGLWTDYLKKGLTRLLEAQNAPSDDDDDDYDHDRDRDVVQKEQAGGKDEETGEIGETGERGEMVGRKGGGGERAGGVLDLPSEGVEGEGEAAGKASEEEEVEEIVRVKPAAAGRGADGQGASVVPPGVQAAAAAAAGGGGPDSDSLSKFFSASNPIFVCKNLTVNLTIVDCNDSAARILRVAQNERSTRIFGQSPVVFSPPVQPEGILSAVASEQRWLDIATSNGRPFRFPWVHMSIDGQMFLVEVMAMVLVDGPDTFHITMWKQYLNSSSLTRELRLAARAKRAAERSRVQFLANMSHELRTPINGVLGYAQLMMQTQLDPEQQSYLQSIYESGEVLLGTVSQAQLDPEQQSYLQSIYESGEVLLGTVSQVLEMSQLQKREVVPRQVRFDLHRAIGEAAGSMRPLAHRKGLQVGAAGCRRVRFNLHRAIGEAAGSMRLLAHRKGLQEGANGCWWVLMGAGSGGKQRVLDQRVLQVRLGKREVLPRLVRFDLHRAIGEATGSMRPLAHRKGLQFGISMDRAVPHAVLGDPPMLRQLLLHLLSSFHFPSLPFLSHRPSLSHPPSPPLQFGISMDRAVPHAVLGDPSMLRQLLLHLLSSFHFPSLPFLSHRPSLSHPPSPPLQFGISMDRAVPHAVLGDPSMLRQLLLHLLSSFHFPSLPFLSHRPSLSHPPSPPLQFGISMDRAVPHAVLGDPSMLRQLLLHLLSSFHFPSLPFLSHRPSLSQPPSPPLQFGISMDRAVPHAVLGDPSMLRQLLLHLLSSFHFPSLPFLSHRPSLSHPPSPPLQFGISMDRAVPHAVLGDPSMLHFGISMDRAVPHAVLGDPSMLRQLLLHLLSNALKFTHQGTVQLTVHVLAPPGAAAGSAAGADSLASSLFSRVPPSLWQFGISMDRAVPHAVLGDPSMRQLLLHLLSNALKFTHQGTVQLTVRVLAPPGAAAGSAAGADSLASSLFSRVPPSLWQFGISMDRAVPHAVLGDPSMLRQLLLHLLSNALKFTHQGTVQLTVHVLAPPGAAAGAAGVAGTAGSGGGVGAGGKQRGVGRRVSQVMGKAGEGLQGGLVGRELQEQEGKQEQQQAEQVQEQEQQEEEACSAAESQAVWGRSEGGASGRESGTRIMTVSEAQLLPQAAERERKERERKAMEREERGREEREGEAREAEENEGEERDKDGPGTEFRASKQITRLSFEVVDTGVGVPPNMLHQIFKPFVQVDDSAAREYQGLGLGLAIAQSLVRLLGGEGIHIESEPDKGSCFAFTLPFEVWRGEARGGREKRRGREGEIVGGERGKVEGEGGSGREVLEGGFGDNGGGRGKRARIVEERLDAVRMGGERFQSFEADTGEIGRFVAEGGECGESSRAGKEGEDARKGVAGSVKRKRREEGGDVDDEMGIRQERQGEEVGGGMWGEVQGGEWGEEGSDEMEEERGKNRGEGRGGSSDVLAQREEARRRKWRVQHDRGFFSGARRANKGLFEAPQKQDQGFSSGAGPRGEGRFAESNPLGAALIRTTSPISAALLRSEIPIGTSIGAPMDGPEGASLGASLGGSLRDFASEPLSHDPEVQAQGHGPAPNFQRTFVSSPASLAADGTTAATAAAVAGASSLRSSQGANAATEGRAAVAVGAAAVSTETSNAHQAAGAGRHGVVVGSEAVNRSVLQPVAAAATAPTAAAVAGVATVTRGNKAGPAGTAGAGKTGAGLKCLVVDDNAVNRSVLQRLLRSLGAEQLVLARNGAEAVAVCEKDGEGLDVVFMDLHMPVMDGFEASTRILGLWRSRYGSDAVPRTSSMSQQQQQQVQAVQPLQPQQVQLQQQDYSFRYRPLLVAITASALEEEEEKCRKVGMDFFLTKPALLSEVASLSF